jgi:hypothetical protein
MVIWPSIWRYTEHYLNDFSNENHENRKLDENQDKKHKNSEQI